MSVEKYAFANLQNALAPTLHRKGFRRDARRFLVGVDEVELSGRLPTRRPDAWAIVPHPSRDEQWNILWFEIEDTSPLSQYKLEDLSEFWFDCDCSDTINLVVVVTDRYGMNQRVLDMQTVWYTTRYGQERRG